MKDKEVTCPFFKRDRGNGQIYCEACVFKCPDKEFRRELVYDHCAHPQGYKNCMIYAFLLHHYERKFADV